MVHINLPLLIILLADRQNFGGYNKLMQRTTESLKVLEVRDLGLTIDENSITHTIAIDRVTQVGFQHSNRLLKGRKMNTSGHELTQRLTRLIRRAKYCRPRQNTDALPYQVRWNSHKANNDTFKAPSSIPHHFLSRCWRLVADSIGRIIPVICIMHLKVRCRKK